MRNVKIILFIFITRKIAWWNISWLIGMRWPVKMLCIFLFRYQLFFCFRLWRFYCTPAQRPIRDGHRRNSNNNKIDSGFDENDLLLRVETCSMWCVYTKINKCNMCYVCVYVCMNCIHFLISFFVSFTFLFNWKLITLLAYQICNYIYIAAFKPK